MLGRLALVAWMRKRLVDPREEPLRVPLVRRVLSACAGCAGAEGHRQSSASTWTETLTMSDVPGRAHTGRQQLSDGRLNE